MSKYPLVWKDKCIYIYIYIYIFDNIIIHPKNWQTQLKILCFTVKKTLKMLKWSATIKLIHLKYKVKIATENIGMNIIFSDCIFIINSTIFKH